VRTNFTGRIKEQATRLTPFSNMMMMMMMMMMIIDNADKGTEWTRVHLET
jgi:hypothetical protein